MLLMQFMLTLFDYQDALTLTEIAMMSGFQSIPSFNRVFRDEKGMAPRDYRALFVSDK